MSQSSWGHLKPDLDQVRAEHGYPQGDGHGG
jgi:hypothetical protein